ncbi:hypothetical protein [Microvirga splendida]|uniref:Uncharacterized protein n=1 Tax=Microvirga splendida TaxID=2795727 RepID=A0ABS0Y0F1_9HYPH|nr:hypothetical protein [Microvirga splendida]MBJ6125420.1 hypothetical protein [Microvirga splendida]
MGRDIRRVRIAGRERTRRYRARLREAHDPSSNVVHRAIRRAMSEVLAAHQGPDAEAVAGFLATVAKRARRSLRFDGYDADKARVRVARAIMPEQGPAPIP